MNKDSQFSKRDLVIIKYFLEELENAELLDSEKKMILEFCQQLPTFSCLDLRKKKPACPFSIYRFEGKDTHEILCTCRDRYEEIFPGVKRAYFCPLDQLEQEKVKQLLK